MMKRVPIVQPLLRTALCGAAAALLLVPAALLPVPAAWGQDKPRIVILNFESNIGVEGGAKSAGAKETDVFLDSKQFDIVDRATTEKIIEEWAIPTPASEQRKGARLGARYKVDLFVTAKLIEFTEDGSWTVAFVLMDSRLGYTSRAAMLEEKGSFHSFLDAKDTGMAKLLADLKDLFKIPDNPNKPKPTRASQLGALSGEQVNALMAGKTAVILETYFVRYKAGGRWALSDLARGPFSEKGKWWIKEDMLCQEIPNVATPVCRYVKVDKEEGSYFFLFDDGLEEEFSLQ